MYEIPQQLEYKEKIVFGLTFEQLGYALIFSPMIFIILFRLNTNLTIRIFLAIIPTLLAAGFMFFDLLTNMKYWYTWIKSRNLITPEEIKKALESKNKKLAILEIEPINFSIKPQKEKEVIILAFQKFLNSIDFPIQILMTTKKLNLDSYLKTISTKNIEDRNKKIFNSYKSHMQKLIKENNAMDRNFYIIIPETTNIELQVKLCEDRLHSLNLKTKRLNKTQILEDFPKQIKNHPDHIQLDNKFYKIIYAHGYPRTVENGFLDRLISCQGNFNFSIHIDPQPLEQTLISLNKEIQKQRADLYSAKLKNQFNPSLEIKYRDTKSILENLQKGQEKLFDMGFIINCKANTLEELNLLSKKIESELNSLLIIPRYPLFRMLQGFKSCLPLAKNFLKITRNITTSALSAFFPFTSSFFKFDKTGIWLGLNKNNIPIIRDIFQLSNSNGICLASSGAGKSYMTKLFITRHLLNGTKTIVIDPQSEYKSLVKKFEGQRINLSRTSKTIINPLDLMGHNYAEKRLSLMDLMPVMLGDLSEPQKSFIDQALTEAYEKKGFYMEDKSWNNEPPILGDVLKILEKMEKKAINLEKMTLRSLINRLRLYVTGVFSFLNRHTNIDFNNNFVCFDIGNMPKQVKPAIMFLVLDYVYMKMKTDLQRKLLVIDEAWTLLSRTEEASYIFEIVKTCRKFNMGLFLINQEVEGMLSSQAGRSALANSSYTILLRQKPAVIEGIQKVFHLSNAERTVLLTAGVGEGILIMENEHSELKVVASSEEHKQITTNADELLEEEEFIPKPIIKNKKQIKIDVDKNIKLHKSKHLNKSEKEYLGKHRFKEYSFRSVFSNRKEKYFLKPRFNESPQHFFLTYDIANYLKKFTNKVQLFETKKPDIIFEIDKKKYAVEVETGKVLKKNKKQLLEKVKALNKEYGKNWFFVMTDRNLCSKYSKFGKTYDKRGIAKQLLKLIN
jgi:conjugal transfer ATP-binding protein TraC